MPEQHQGKFEGPINIAAGGEVAIRDLVTRIAELTETSVQLRIGELPYRPTEIWRMYADSSRACETLGWRPKISLNEGLGKTIAWFREYNSEEIDGSHSTSSTCDQKE